MLSDSEIKDELLNLLKNVSELLEKYNLKYSIWAGTLLGAVRHKGFIPWDDDIDIAMERGEYEKLIEIIKNDDELINHFVGYELGKNDFPFLKFVNTKISVSSAELLDKYLWLDIFPIDKVPEPGKIFFARQRWLNRNYWIYRENKYGVTIGKSTNWFKKIIYRIRRFYLSREKEEKIVNKMIKHAEKYKNRKAKSLCCVINGVYEKEIFPIEYMDSFQKIQFENESVSCIEKHKEWLTIRYGNYMEIPPVEARETHSLNVFRNM